MRLKALHEGLADEVEKTFGIFAIVDAIESYLRENLPDELVHRAYQDMIKIGRGSEASTVITVNENGMVSMAHSHGTGTVSLERVNVHDPDSFPKIHEFVNRFNYEAI
jgi:hypothetical protein